MRNLCYSHTTGVHLATTWASPPLSEEVEATVRRASEACFGRGPGHMGSERITQKGVTVVDVIASQNLLLVRGGVPGAKGGLVEVRTDA